MKLTDEKISAWLDGELPDEEAAHIAAALESDFGLKEQIEEWQRTDALLREAVPLDEDLPPAFLDRLGLGEKAQSAVVLPLVQPRPEQAPQQQASSATATRRRFGGWQMAAQIALVACLGIAGAIWLAPSGNQPEGQYRALSASPAGSAMQPSIVVLFEDSVDSTLARSIAEDVGAEIAGEPTSTGAWPLRVNPAELDRVIQDLRRRNDVVLAEPIGGG